MPRAGQDLGELGFELGSFRMVERSGKVVTEADLAGDVWVSAFIFTRCPMSCPRISSVMKGLQDPLGKAGVRLVSFSVDPDFDTPEVLTRYAQGLGADPARWWFLTGKADEVVSLILDRFHLPVERANASDSSPEAKAEAVRHSPRLVLVDRGNKVVGYFDSNEPDAVAKLVSMARRKASWARHLPAVNASLNGTCAVLLVLGWSLILTGRVRGHAACMISAVAVSAVFLACYLTYHFQVGSVAFRGVGLIQDRLFHRSSFSHRPGDLRSGPAGGHHPDPGGPSGIPPACIDRPGHVPDLALCLDHRRRDLLDALPASGSPDLLLSEPCERPVGCCHSSPC